MVSFNNCPTSIHQSPWYFLYPSIIHSAVSDDPQTFHKMPLLGLTWDPTFLRTRAGMSLALESGVGLVGALIGFVFANGFESFLMWGAFFASGFFLFTHVTNLTQSLESRFPFLAKVVRIFLLKCFFQFIWINSATLPPAPCLYGCMVFGCGNHGDLPMRYLVNYGGEASIDVYF